MSDLPPLPNGSVVTVGTFDGVHLGHQAVIAEVVRRARARSRAAVLVTFEPHPMAVLKPGSAPPRLTGPGERTDLLAETGLDYAFVLRFDAALAALEPEAFIRRVLVERCQARELVVGHDHGFGRGRAADASTLPALGERLGLAVDVVAPVAGAGGGPVSSSRIRAAVEAGDFATAEAGLGRPYRVSGRVARGAQRGRTIGVPTVNVAPPPGKLLPPDGVYAVRVEWGGGVANAMLNQGPRPTVGDTHRWLEAHLFDFDGDLYGRVVRMEWVAWLRAVRKFDSLEQLRAQLDQDGQAARRILSREGRRNPNEATA